jgi:flagellar P-ring protein precursor FlgI
LAVGGLILCSNAWAVRLKDVARIAGVRDNALIGYGLVVGLNGTGDGTKANFTFQSLQAFLRRNGITVEDNLDAENVAAVVVTASLPSYAKPGSKIDVLVSSIGDCENLQGGVLLATTLKAGDGKVYAVAQGPVVTGGFKASQGGTSIQENHPTVGRVSNGATVERATEASVNDKSQIMVSLNNPDFVTAVRVCEAINRLMGDSLAHAVDPGSVGVLIPAAFQGRVVEFVSKLEMMPVNPDQRARVILDEKTGTVIMGENVRISTIAVAHGNLSILITEERDVSQPEPFSRGETVPVTQTAIQAGKEGGPERNLSVVEEGVTITELVSGLNALGVSPRDLIAILQAIKASGALQADLEVI